MEWGALVCAAWAAVASRPGVAFFYARPVPVPELAQFGAAVVQPGNISGAELQALRARGTAVFAYLSAGEIEPGTPAPAEWSLGTNAAWGSRIADPASPGWRAWLGARAASLQARGFDGLFLDTIDAYRAVPGQRDEAMAALLRGLHAAAPKLKLIFNRGFEVLPLVPGLPCAVAAESLFSRWDPLRRAFGEVPAADRDWLLGKLRALDVPVIVLDYLPPSRRDEAREVARRIDALGFVPWVAQPAFDRLGVGAVEIVRRRVLALTEGDPLQSPAFRFAALPLESLGFAVEYADVHAALPEGDYAGVLAWLSAEPPRAVEQWLSRQLESGARVAFLGAVPRGLLGRLGLAPAVATPRIVRADALLGFEAPPVAHEGAQAFRTRFERHLVLGGGGAAVVTAPWGGVALAPFVVEADALGRTRWILDPFAFFSRAFGEVPAPQPALRNGLRRLTVRIEPDGFGDRAERPGAPWAAAVLLREVLQQRRWPTAVSLPDGPAGLKERYRAQPFIREEAALDGEFGVESLTEIPPRLRPDGSLSPAGPSDLAFGARGYDAAIAVFQRTAALLPVALRFHFFAGSRDASLSALQRVYGWAQAQPLAPVPEDDYAQAVRAAHDAVFARRLDGALLVPPGVTELKLPRGAPDLQRSRGVLGSQDGLVHLAPEGALVVLQDGQPAGPSLAWSNGAALGGSLADGLRLHAEVPLRVAVRAQSCDAEPQRREQGLLVFVFEGRDATLACR